MAYKLAFVQNKGGVLKSSMAVNLAGLYAKQGKKVLIVDADQQGNILLSFGKNPDDYKPTLYDVLVD
ncbi:ParA family protein, partial [Escherichia sp. R-CC3]